MKNKIGFNIFFAIIAFPILLALLREFDFQNCTFKNTPLGILYLIVFVILIFLMLKKGGKSDTKSN